MNIAAFDFEAHLARQAAFSALTFGPGARTEGICDHIRKELVEVAAAPGDLKEWIDVAILALDGAWRCGATPAQIIEALVAKQIKNEGRAWPDWRTADPAKAIEHDRSGESAAAPQVVAKLPKWIDDKKGSDPLVDDLIAYIEKIAAPQVVADERAAFEASEPGMHLVRDDDGEYENPCVASGWKSWQDRADLVAAPVQAQEPVPKAAQQNGGLVRAALVDLLGLERHAMAIAMSFEVQSDYRARFARARQALAAPVQPVAVPDGWKLVPSEPNDAMQAAGAQAVRIDTTVINKIWTGNAVFRAMIAASPAAPAAQAAS